MRPLYILTAGLLALGACSQVVAGPADFKTGPVFTDFGPIAPMQDSWALPADTKLRVAFDVADPSDGERLNRTLESAARFVNMHVKAGVSQDNIDVAVVVHGGAVTDLVQNDHYAARMDGKDNPNISAIEALTSEGIRIILCGQTAAYRDVTPEMLLPNVEMSLSTMTAHAQLQNAGYSLNPF